jgi:hypothetical protein
MFANLPQPFRRYQIMAKWRLAFVSVVYSVALICMLAIANGQNTADPANPFVGRWRTLETSKGGIGAIYEFRVDGNATFSPGATVEVPYRVEGDQLITPPTTTKSTVEQRSKIAWRGEDYLRLIDEDGTERTFQRSGFRDPSNKLLGEWVGTQDMNGVRMESRWMFSPNGKSLFLLPFLRQPGRYTVTKDSINADFSPRSTLIGTFKVENGVMIVSRTKDKTTDGIVKLIRY